MAIVTPPPKELPSSPLSGGGNKGQRRPLIVITLLSLTTLLLFFLSFFALHRRGPISTTTTTTGGRFHLREKDIKIHHRVPEEVSLPTVVKGGADNGKRQDAAARGGATADDASPPQQQGDGGRDVVAGGSTSAADAATEVEGSGGDTSSPLPATPVPTGSRVTSLKQLSKQKPYFMLYHPALKVWMSRAIDTNVATSATHEKIFKLKKTKSPRHTVSYAIQGHTRLHLTCELNNKITLDRPWARGFEMWDVEFVADGQFAVLKSLRNSKYVTVSPDHQSLIAEEANAGNADRWIMYTVDSCTDDLSCWGPLTRSAVGATNQSAAEQKIDRTVFPLFGSPKPLQKMEPVASDDPYDAFLIARRTLDNWGLIEGVKPLILTTDSNTIQLIEDSNNVTHPSNPIEANPHFEIHKKFDQPTYRGLFSHAFDWSPEAPAIIYSNSDILYTNSLPETIRAVMKYVAKEKKRVMSQTGAKYRVKGWMLVGQRINHNVPAKWQIRDPSTAMKQDDVAGDDGKKSKQGKKQKKAQQMKQEAARKMKEQQQQGMSRLSDKPWWVRDIEDHFSNHGQLFQSNAEDYFIVSRELFDWKKEIPDFVVGGVAFDNWIVARAVRMAARGEAIVVDASKTITALHQNHNIDVKKSHTTPKSEYNAHLAARNGGVSGGKTADAAYATERRPDGTITVYDKHRMLYL